MHSLDLCLSKAENECQHIISLVGVKQATLYGQIVLKSSGDGLHWGSFDRGEGILTGGVVSSHVRWSIADTRDYEPGVDKGEPLVKNAVTSF